MAVVGKGTPGGGWRRLLWEWRRAARAWRAVRGRHGGIRLGRTSSAACQRSSRGEKHGCSHSASRSGSFSCSPRTSLGWQRAGALCPCLRAPRTLCCSGRRCWRPGSGSRRPGGRGRGTGGRGGAGSGSPWGRVYTAVVTRRGRSLGGRRVANEERVTNAKTNISPRHYFPALLSHLSRGLLRRPLFAPRDRPRGSTSTERQKPLSPPVFHPMYSPLFHPLHSPPTLPSISLPPPTHRSCCYARSPRVLIAIAARKSRLDLCTLPCSDLTPSNPDATRPPSLSFLL